MDTRFFFQLSRYFNGKLDENTGYYGYLTKDGDATVLKTEKVIEGREIFPNYYHVFLVTPYFPSRNFIFNEFDRAILTSDGLITLDDNQMIGVKDGCIEELDTEEVLDMLSRAKTEKSPSYQQVRLQSVTKRPKRPSRGTIIYNELSDQYEVYCKNGWKKIKVEDI